MSIRISDNLYIGTTTFSTSMIIPYVSVWCMHISKVQYIIIILWCTGIINLSKEHKTKLTTVHLCLSEHLLHSSTRS